jgi:hypothetical protein
MKIFKILCPILCASILFTACKKNEDDKITPPKNGIIEFKCINPWSLSLKSAYKTKSRLSNPLLLGDTTETLLTSLIITIGDVWVSQGNITVGQPDNLEWVKLTNITNTDLKLFEDYTFPAKEIAVGDYKSIKITLRNIWYRQVKLSSDPTVIYELLETMGSSSDPCNSDDDSWAKTDYFGSGGNHNLDINGNFVLVEDGEKVNGFKIESGKKAIISWRLGAGSTDPCINYLLDLNGNRIWDCGIDDLYDECPIGMEYMWDFVVEYE